MGETMGAEMNPHGTTRTLRELALAAAIELEAAKNGDRSQLASLQALIDALKGAMPKENPDQVGPLKLFPAYRRALVATTQMALNSRNDIYDQFKQTLKSADELLNGDTGISTDRLLAFCLALHGALLAYASDDLVGAPIEERRLERVYG